MESELIHKHLRAKLDLDSTSARVMLVGMGITGLSVARFLSSINIAFKVVDNRDKPPLQQVFIDEFGELESCCGPFNEDQFNGVTHLLVSPGVSLNEPVLRKVLAGNVRLFSDIDLFTCANDKPVIAITGSNGKSTVTTLVGEMAKADGKNAAIGGNLGVPALDLLQPESELYVLELSSFQLERSGSLNASAACVLNISPDHMDRYRDVQDYAQQKRRIFNGNGVMVINGDDPLVACMREPTRKCLTFGIAAVADFHIDSHAGEDYLMYAGRPLLPVKDVLLQGRHNLENALAALALGTAAGFKESAMCQALRTFQGLEHRMQQVAEINGVNWINDSKATNIGACIAALKGLDNKVILIAGGDAKGADMEPLAPVVKEKVRAVVLLGKDAQLIDRALDGCVSVYHAENLRQAVKQAANLVQAGESVLLSPACASLDQFASYQERGREFCAAVRGLPA